MHIPTAHVQAIPGMEMLDDEQEELRKFFAVKQGHKQLFWKPMAIFWVIKEGNWPFLDNDCRRHCYWNVEKKESTTVGLDVVFLHTSVQKASDLSLSWSWLGFKQMKP